MRKVGSGVRCVLVTVDVAVGYGCVSMRWMSVLCVFVTGLCTVVFFRTVPVLVLVDGACGTGGLAGTVAGRPAVLWLVGWATGAVAVLVDGTANGNLVGSGEIGFTILLASAV